MKAKSNCLSGLLFSSDKASRASFLITFIFSTTFANFQYFFAISKYSLLLSITVSLESSSIAELIHNEL